MSKNTTKKTVAKKAATNTVKKTVTNTIKRTPANIIKKAANKNIEKTENLNNKKVTFNPGTMLNPVPVVMVSCGNSKEEYNIITIAWTGIINSDPPLTYISVRKSRHSHDLLVKNREFVINLVSEDTAFAADFCGVKSGREIDKFVAQKLTPIPAEIVKAPMIGECPVNIECKVMNIVSYPTHDMFISEIVKVHANEALMDQRGKLRLEEASLICFSHGAYYGLKKESLGKFGYSIMKAKTKSRISRGKSAGKGSEKSR